MKRILPHPARETSPKMWRSLGELENSPEFVESLEREFPQGAQYFEESGISRRDFVRLMGASAALAGIGLSGCRRPEAHLVPFTKTLEWTIPGKFLHYATSMPSRVGAQPLVVTTVDGRPTKIEGNPLHPNSNGGTTGFAQATILDLYDPNRSKSFLNKGVQTDVAAWDTQLNQLRQDHLANQGEGLAFLSEQADSPTRDRLRTLVQTQFPKATWTDYEPWDGDQAKITALAYGDGVRLIPRFDKADVVVALDYDFLNCGEVGVDFARGFSARRDPAQSGLPMNRLYAIESYFTLTGGMADHRLRAKQSDIPAIAAAIGARVAEATGNKTLASVVAALPFGPKEWANHPWVTACADDLINVRGRGILGTRAQQSSAVQGLVLAINEGLGNVGSTIDAVKVPAGVPTTSIGELADSIRAGRVQTLFIFGGNPAYNGPADLALASLIETIPNSVRLGLFEDETSKVSKWHVPAAHYLESWADARSLDGTYTAGQPMILPLYGGLSELDILAVWAGLPKPVGPELVRDTFRQVSQNGDSFDFAWNEFLRTGFLAETAYPLTATTFNSGAVAQEINKAVPPTPGAFELVFQQSSSVDDGRYANNSWLLETPDFITKLTWDNAALLSPATAKKLAVKNGDMLEIASGSTKIPVAALVAPGQADDSVSVAIGYGRKDVSALMQNVGFDVYPLRTTKAWRFAPDVTIRPTGETYLLAFTQEHASMEGRDHAREGTLDQFKEAPTFAQTIGMDSHIPPNISLYTNPPLTSKEQWAMTVDLNTCTGCNACIVACQAENNVPVVGKDQVHKNREMAWIRIDRWFAGDAENPEMVAQAVMCQHCENAPCETVCPVNATVHSEDGLNLMAYNRCIGTRYCSNNCPWKVRRFNFFDYNERPIDQLYFGPLAKKGMAESLKMSKNPNVTVRMRGVMEKCTFCIQRIEEAKIARLVQAGPTPSSQTPVGEFKTACQQACPSDAIVFGNENNPNARVTKLRASDRGYVTLKYLNTRPRVTYLARIKNPNMAMPGADKVGHINTEAHGHGHGGGHGHENGHGEPQLSSGTTAHDAEQAPPVNSSGH